uniref:Deacetylase sirtuin-type domain-containing protein n=1 Tax=Chromera velia CCMP2878 TaxID=1169474 RepID=A0A0G4HT79_9ALVE|eukprot:Cvel_31314.t1-p1 / transcript=Cvel_31314.t1 / gene=Cvel_31314 / organism=Chromera_velia_CCMP2878 / gene_product=NAD-dependent protein deacetylase hst2-1, putative / transcript_product=NAD-dependent protein deacetylase hst2-1, putative / location=Cvel_scaffold4645:2601-4085(+) / protein_length=495 / sequence_SO=supercontig / SO=protein_coding / is_pseudo=false
MRPQPRRLLLRVGSPGALNRSLTKAPKARVSIPELADEASPLPEGWVVVGWSQTDLTDTVGNFIAKAAYQLEHEIPDFMKGLPQIQSQVESLKRLLKNPNFSVMVTEQHRQASGDPNVPEGQERERGEKGEEEEDEDTCTQSFFGPGDEGEVIETFGTAGVRPPFLEAPTLEAIGRALGSGHFRSVLLMTGAGVSTNSGIPDYRSAGGMYASIRPDLLTAAEEEREAIKRDPTFVANIRLFRQNPLPLLEVKREFVLGSANGTFRPTATHMFARILHEKGYLMRVLTQNIDGLHTAAGVPSEKVLEVHGSIRNCVCSECGTSFPFQNFAEKVRESVKSLHGLDASAPSESSVGSFQCESKFFCNGIIRPAVVLFGESLPKSFDVAMDEEVSKADLLLVAGTSLTVAPANQVPSVVPLSCVRLVINGQRVGEHCGLVFDSPYSQRDLLLEGDLDEGVAALCRAAGWGEDLEGLVDEMASASRETVRRVYAVGEGDV